jgi:hypothetical protein
MKQTAVDWLINEHFGGIENCTPDFRNKIKKANEMFKQEVLRSHIHNRCLQDQTYECTIIAFNNAERYYKYTFETFKSE